MSEEKKYIGEEAGRRIVDRTKMMVNKSFEEFKHDIVVVIENDKLKLKFKEA